MKEYKTCEEVLAALKEGKKLIGPGHMRRLCEGGIGCQYAKWYKVLYYYCNPQMNRTFAMLENGQAVDTSIDILDLLYGCFYDYDEVMNITSLDDSSQSVDYKESDVKSSNSYDAHVIVHLDTAYNYFEECSVCHSRDVSVSNNYCPNCGVKFNARKLSSEEDKI